MTSTPRSEWRQLSRRLAARVLLRACNSVGTDVQLHGRPRIVNQGYISVGDRFQFTSDPVMSHLLADRGGRIEIGDDVSVGYGSGIAARGRIRIGNGSRLGAFLLAMDTDYHVPGDGRAVADVNPIEIGAGVRIGNRVTILRGSVIGDGAVVLDGSVVSGAVSPGERVAGVPARPSNQGMRGRGHETVDLRVRRVAQLAFRLQHLPSLAQERLEIDEWDSLGTLSLLLALEEEFGVTLGEDQMRDVNTLSDAAQVISFVLERG